MKIIAAMVTAMAIVKITVLNVSDMYYLVECLIIKNENQYLIEHITKNAQSGIEHFYVYDNYSDEPVKIFLEKNAPELLNICTVELIEYTTRLQIDCYLKFLSDHRDDTVWCAFFDTDEIVEGNLFDLCKNNEKFLSLKIFQTMHGANGQAYYDPTKTMTEKFISSITHKPQYYKMVSQVKYVTIQCPHHSYIYAPEIKKELWMKHIRQNKAVKLHHYFFKSFEEWLMKINRGNVLSFIGNQVKLFFEENNIDDKDRDALLGKYNLKLNDRMLYGNMKRE